MRDVPCGRGPMPGGVWRRLGRVEVQARTKLLSRGSSEVSVELQLSSPLRRKKGRTVFDLSAKLQHQVDVLLLFSVWIHSAVQAKKSLSAFRVRTCRGAADANKQYQD